MGGNLCECVRACVCNKVLLIGGCVTFYRSFLLFIRVRTFFVVLRHIT